MQSELSVLVLTCAGGLRKLPPSRASMVLIRSF